MRAIFRNLPLFFFGALPAAAMASSTDYILERACIVDDATDLGIDDVRQRPAQLYEGVLSRGFADAAIWIRLPDQNLTPHLPRLDSSQTA